MAQMTARTLGSSALAGTSVPRTGPFTSRRPSPRNLVVRAQQVRSSRCFCEASRPVRPPSMRAEYSQTAVLSRPAQRTPAACVCMRSYVYL